MKKILESDVKKKVKDLLDWVGKRVPIYTMTPATFGYGESGHPDRLLYIKGYLLGIECKLDGNTSLLRPELKPTQSEKAQKIMLRRLRAAGGYPIVVHKDNLKEFKVLLENIIGMEIDVRVEL